MLGPPFSLGPQIAPDVRMLMHAHAEQELCKSIQQAGPDLCNLPHLHRMTEPAEQEGVDIKEIQLYI